MNASAKTKKMVLYMLSIVLKNIAIFIGIMIFCSALGISLVTISVSGTNSETYGYFDFVTASLIFMGFVGVSGFSEDFKLFMQNCFTRKEIFRAQIVYFLTTSFILSAIIMSLVTIFSSLTDALKVTGIFGQIYRGEIGILTEFFITFLATFIVAVVSYLITILFNRYDKKKVGLAFVLAFLVIVSFFTTIVAIIPKDIMRAIFDGLAFAFGFTKNGVFPYHTIITFLISSVAFSFIGNRLLMKLELK